jgi:hypothetical protein
VWLLGWIQYNNQDHSMLTAMMAVENILAGVKSKQNLWDVNTEQEYHEQKAEAGNHPEAPVEGMPPSETDREIAA